MKNLISENNDLGVPKNSGYDLTGTGYEFHSEYVFAVVENEDTLVFGYDYWEKSVLPDSRTMSMLSLTRVSVLGKFPSKTTSDLFFFQKSEWTDKFEKLVLNKLKLSHTEKKDN